MEVGNFYRVIIHNTKSSNPCSSQIQPHRTSQTTGSNNQDGRPSYPLLALDAKARKYKLATIPFYLFLTKSHDFKIKQIKLNGLLEFVMESKASRVRDSGNGAPVLRFGSASPVSHNVSEPVVELPLRITVPLIKEPVPRSTTPSESVSEARKSWSELFLTPLSTPTKGCNVESEEENDLPEMVLTWRSLQVDAPLRAEGLANYGNMCFLNSVLG
jgi:hypothetical protein